MNDAPASRTDAELMVAYGCGDADAFALLYARHKGSLYRYMLRHSNPNMADELFQDVWTRVIDHRQRYRPEAKFSTWLYRIARNRLIDYYRKQGREFTGMDTESEPGDSNPEQTTRQSQLRTRFEQHLDALPTEQREAFVLREERGFSLPEIADITGVDRETVKSRLRYAVNKLKRALKSDYQVRAGLTEQGGTTP